MHRFHGARGFKELQVHTGTGTGRARPVQYSRSTVLKVPVQCMCCTGSCKKTDGDVGDVRMYIVVALLFLVFS